MTQQKNQPQEFNQELDPETMKYFFQVQQQHAAIEVQQLKIEEMRIGADAKLAEKSMDLNAKLLLAGPGHKQKHFIITSAVVIIIMLLFLSFIGWLVYSGKEEFVIKFLNWLVHLVFGVIGFFVGRSTGTKNQDHSQHPPAIQEAEVMKY